ncbi:DUF4265 domain-containing protein [Rhodobacteraceae bacterium RKSG542]|uniref:DUF4265 domain-containing protein n=1 Tax=Pseudovibrio flavus TaxID=2529854 RepID=UPI0012BBC21A|nr:DUF4265 domain-containing protein [Pseudovibrio flavus]MTI17161.1 DUF4265 domain-containing protein [Pseudovibrio flavus]
MSNNQNVMKMDFPLDPEEWHGAGKETLWVTPLGGNRYRVDNMPFLAKGVSLNDEVTGVRTKRGLQFSEIFKHRGHSTFRILVEETATPEEFQEQWLKLAALGCTCEDIDGDIPLFSVDVPPTVNVKKVIIILEDVSHMNIWEFEEGHCYQAEAANSK